MIAVGLSCLASSPSGSLDCSQSSVVRVRRKSGAKHTLTSCDGLTSQHSCSRYMDKRARLPCSSGDGFWFTVLGTHRLRLCSQKEHRGCSSGDQRLKLLARACLGLAWDGACARKHSAPTS